MSFSGGRSSAFTLLNYGPFDHVVFMNTGKEHEKTLKFIEKISIVYNIPITWIEYDPITRFKIVDFKSAARAGEPFKAMVEKKKYLPNPTIRLCTAELKIIPYQYYLRSIGVHNYINVMGIRYDEITRWPKLLNNTHKNTKFTTYYNELPMVEARVTKQEVLEFWKKQPFDLELDSKFGNCDLCFLKGKRNKID